MSQNKKKKRKLKFGDYLIQNATPINQGANLAGSVIDATTQPTSIGGGIASGALKGAGNLAALGPYGMAAGAVIGGVSGAINANKAQQLEEDQQLGEAAGTARMGLLSRGMNKGGKLKSKLNVVHGGELQGISPDAVEVQADNPQATDSVELDQAFVDNGEIIDNKDRVFSDELISSTGKSFAKEAKKLEKMKSKSSRFTDANKFLDSKLNKLFSEQESSKPRDSKGKFAKGGKLKLVNGGIDTSAFYPNALEKPAMDELGTTMNALSVDLPATTGASRSELLGPATGTPINWNTALTGAATFLPNAISAGQQKKLRGPATPVLQGKSKFKTVSADPYIAESTRQYQGASKNLRNKMGQASQLGSNQNALLARKVAADNAALGQVDQINAGIQANKARLDTIVDSNNTQLQNYQREQKIDFDNTQRVRTTDNAANLSGKVLGQIAQKNAIDRDKFALEVMSKSYGDSGIWNRQVSQMLDEYLKKKGLKSGGKLPKLNKKKSK